MKKSTTQFLSVLFHLFVLICMVLVYDAGKLVATNLGFIEGAVDESAEASLVDFSEEEEKTLSTEINPELAKYVDKTAEGYVFRTDGAFPKRLKVIATEVTRFKDVKMAQRVGDKSSNSRLTSRLEKIMEFEIAGSAVRFIKRQDLHQKKRTPAERVERLKVLAEAKEKGQEPPADDFEIIGDLVGKAVQFNYTDDAWKAKPSGEFKLMAWGKSLEENVSEILVENGLRPKRQWFDKKRLPIGHEISLGGKGLGFVMAEAAKGKLDLKFVAVEGVHGHPCAAFDISGSITLKETTNDIGQRVSGEETIESGRVWFSLLYPVMLRAEMDKIVSYDTRENGKLVGQFQGNTYEHFHADWKVVTGKKKETVESKNKAVQN
ncbi:MAG: hypothetical protein AB8D78_14050 [Akkermansiaceae bacterium]